MLLNFLLLVLHLFFLCYFFLKRPEMSLFFYVLFFGPVLIYSSVIYLNFFPSVYIIEQGRKSFTAGNVHFLGVFFILCSFVSYSFCTFKISLPPSFVGSPNHRNLLFLLVLCVFFECLLFFNLASSPVPLFGGGDRFTYWESSKYPSLSLVLGKSSSLLAFMFGFIFFKSRNFKVRFFSLAFFVVYLFYILLIGNKFSALLFSFFLFFVTFFICSGNFHFKIKYFFFSVFLFFALYFLVYNYYSIHNDYSEVFGYSVNQAILYRVFALQGHLNWASFADCSLWSCASFVDSELQPMHSIMVHFSGLNAYSSIDRGVSLTNAFPSFLVYKNGIALGLLLSFFSHVFISLVARFLIYSVKKGDIIQSILLMQSFSWLSYSLYMGNFQSSYKAFFLVSFVLFMYFFSFFFVGSSNENSHYS